MATSRALTSHNAERLAQLDLPKAEHFTFAGAGGTNVHGDAAEAAVVRRLEEVPAADGAARRTGNAVRRHVELPLEHADAAPRQATPC